MAKFIILPPGQKSRKYEGKKMPMSPYRKQRIYMRIMFFIMLIETSYIIWSHYVG